MFRASGPLDPTQAFTQSMDIGDFRSRQAADQLRYRVPTSDSTLRKRQPFHMRFDQGTPGRQSRRSQGHDYDDDDCAVQTDDEEGFELDDPPISTAADAEAEAEAEGEEGWRNSEGERLRDFGVDEDVEFYDEDEVPLAELIRRRKAADPDGYAAPSP